MEKIHPSSDIPLCWSHTLRSTCLRVIVIAADGIHIFGLYKVLAGPLSDQHHVLIVGGGFRSIVVAKIEGIGAALSLRGRCTRPCWRIGITIIRVLYVPETAFNGASYTTLTPPVLLIGRGNIHVGSPADTYLLASVDHTPHETCLIGLNDSLANVILCVVECFAILKAVIFFWSIHSLLQLASTFIATDNARLIFKRIALDTLLIGDCISRIENKRILSVE